MDTYNPAKRKTKLLQIEKLQSTNKNLNYSWRWLRYYNDSMIVLLSYLNFFYNDFIGISLEHVFKSLNLPNNFTSLHELNKAGFIVKKSLTHLVSNFKLPEDTNVWNIDFLFNKKISIRGKAAALYIQAITPPYIEEKWVPESFVPAWYKEELLNNKHVLPDLNGLKITI